MKMSMMDAVKSCFKKYATFEGRARRSEYWKFYLFNLIITAILSGISSVFISSGGEGSQMNPAAGVLGLYGLATLIPGISVEVRRWHDIGKTGWYYFIKLIPLVGFILFIVWMCREGDHGVNQFGTDPKSGVSDKPVPPEKYWICKNCGAKVRETAAFCTSCGAKKDEGFKTPRPETFWTCEVCGTKVKESAKYCTSCGTQRGGKKPSNLWDNSNSFYN